MTIRELLSFGRAHCSLIFLVMISLGCAAGQTTTTTQAHASVSGHVFLITEGGDLKPARFADIYLISDKVVGQESAERAFLDEYDHELKVEAENIESGAMPTSEVCQNELLMVTQSVLQATKWAEKNNLGFAVLSSQTDENGEFNISGIKLNHDTANKLLSSDGKKPYYQWEYTIVAKGHAGANDAYWQAEIIFIQINGKTQWHSGASSFIEGKDVHIKLSSPEKSCLRIPQD